MPLKLNVLCMFDDLDLLKAAGLFLEPPFTNVMRLFALSFIVHAAVLDIEVISRIRGLARLRPWRTATMYHGQRRFRTKFLKAFDDLDLRKMAAMRFGGALY